jgi:hypothetical protein
MFRAVFNKYELDNQALNWSNLPMHERERRWMSEFRMVEDDFAYLFRMVKADIPKEEPRNPSMRRYKRKEKLLITLSFLAHCATLRDLATKWAVPHCSISVVCIHPVLNALHKVLVTDWATKTVRFPREASDLKGVIEGFRRKSKLPGVAGAIDGTMTMMKKPTASQANLDTDSYYSYKGGIAMLALCVCDADMQFTYANVGAPACVGDAGLYTRFRLKQQVDDGLLSVVKAELKFGDDRVEEIETLFVGDSAFPLGPHMQKIFSRPTPEEDSDKGRFNRRVINPRRLIEMTFGRLKGRWVFCRRIVFYGDPNFVRTGIEVCCARHNFLEDRDVLMPEDFDEDKVEDLADMMPEDIEDVDIRLGGDAVRDILVDWCKVN